MKSKIKNNITTEINSAWQTHIKGLVTQGRFLEILALEESQLTWKSTMYNLPRGILQFAINASIDTLATNANLKRWSKKSNAKCSLCEKRETLHHTLNNCDTMLERYTWRHNSILSYMYNTIKGSVSDEINIYVDLPFQHEGASTIPLHIAITKQKPDLVVINNTQKHITIMELSVPFESNIDSTHNRKVERYQHLISDIEQNGYEVVYFPIEIGSRAYISKENNHRLKTFFHKLTDTRYNQIKQDICKIVLISSFVIFHSKYDDSWINPAYVRL